MKLHHYTDATALKSMLENGKIWLSDIRYLNDHSEYKDGEGAIRSMFEKKSLDLTEEQRSMILTHLESTFDSSKSSYTFICSLSKGEDLLSQWRGYCPKSGGYALEFELENQKDFTAPLHDCIYESEGKSEAASTLFDLAKKVLVKGGNKSKLFQTTWSNIAKFKNPGFKEENESRVIIFKKQDDPAIRFRTRESLIIPYIEIDLPFACLKSIWVGPCQQPELAKESLSRLIDNLARDPKHPFKKQEKPTVKLSSITYRG
jgi:Protein of unknown function (DUF2971)